MKVKDCMCNNVNFVKPDTSVKDCAKMMCEHHIGCIPVCDCDDKLVGIVTDRDILLRNVACDKDPQNTKISDIMTTDVQCCHCDDDITTAEKIMANEQIRRVPVVDNGKLIGILTLGDLAANEKVFTEDLCNTIEGICGCNKKNAE